MKRVAVYARVSTDHKSQLSALENQIQYYDEQFAKHDDWVLYKRYIDKGITGTSTKNRDGFNRMMQDAKNGCFDLIVTREVSRFSRNTIDSLSYTRDLAKAGVKVYFVEDQLTTSHNGDEFKLSLYSALAQEESEKISSRVKAGQKISYMNGVIYGTGNILGYNILRKEEMVNNKKVSIQEVTINSEQAEVVRFIYDSFLKGMGSTKIKYELERRGALTSTGLSNWNQSTITRILKNPFYCGRILYNKSFVDDMLEHKIKINHGEREQIEVKGTHEPLVTEEEFNRVQEIIRSNSKHIKRAKDYTRPTTVWSKKLVCNCGSTFNRRVYHRDNGNITYCYQCYNQKNNGSKRYRIKNGYDITNSCDVAVVPEWKLELVANTIFTLLCTDKERVFNIISKLLDTNIEVNSRFVDEEIEKLKSNIVRQKSKLNKVLDMRLNDLITESMFIDKKKEIEETIYDAEKLIQELSKDSSEETSLSDKIEELKLIVKSNLSNTNECIAETVIDALFKKIVVKEDKFEFRLNLSNNKDVLLTQLIITKDDVKEYERRHSLYKRLRLKEPIIVDVII